MEFSYGEVIARNQPRYGPGSVLDVDVSGKLLSDRLEAEKTCFDDGADGRADDVLPRWRIAGVSADLDTDALVAGIGIAFENGDAYHASSESGPYATTDGVVAPFGDEIVMP